MWATLMLNSMMPLCRVSSLCVPPCDIWTSVISQGIWASPKLSGKYVLHHSKLQDPGTLGYLLIYALYSKLLAYC